MSDGQYGVSSPAQLDVDDALAERAAKRFRKIYGVGHDKDEFVAAGGTDAGYAVMVELALRQRAHPQPAARAVAEELGIDLDAVPSDDARRAAIDEVLEGCPELVARVVELCRAYPATAGDEELAHRIASQAPARMRADAVAFHQKKIGELKAKADHPYLAAAFDAAAGREGPDPVATATRDQWASCLAKLAAAELGIPETEALFVAEHPAVQRALELVGAISSATAEDVEAHRPHFTLTPTEEQAAHRVAAAAERNLRTEAAEVFHDPGMSPAETAAAVGRALAKKDPRMWHGAIALAATAELGVTDFEHPVVLRAQELISGLPTHYDTLISERAMTPTQAAHEYETILHRHVTHGRGATARVPGLPGEEHRLPPNPPTEWKPGFLQVTHLGGHPALRAGQKRLWLYLSGGVAANVYADPRANRAVATLEWRKVSGLAVEGPEAVASRVTVPRLAAGGLFAFAFKKEQKRAYLVFRTRSGGDVIFETPRKSIWELRAELSPLLKWLGTGSEARPTSVPPPQVTP